MRGVAAVVVAVFHFHGELAPSGYLAVDFFFALSGFVLWKNYAPRFERSGLTTGAFLLCRFIRLYPLFLLGAAFGFIFALQGYLRHSDGAASAPDLVASAIFNIFMLPAPFGRVLYPLNPPAWSLFYELLANAALCAVLVRVRYATSILILCIAAIGLILLDLYNGSLGGGDEWSTTITAIFRTVFSFTAGVVLARSTASLSSCFLS
ncbi:acyltransferase family protein [Novosphingobium flavum]